MSYKNIEPPAQKDRVVFTNDMTAHLFGIIFFLLQNDISPHMMLYRRRQSWWRVCIMHGYNGRHHCAKKRNGIWLKRIFAHLCDKQPSVTMISRGIISLTRARTGTSEMDFPETFFSGRRAGTNHHYMRG
ncbi:hypothetical protein QTP88_007542 [Uroleucon formosanum]